MKWYFEIAKSKSFIKKKITFCGKKIRQNFVINTFEIYIDMLVNKSFESFK